MNMRKQYSVNLFKFDGVAGDPDEMAEEMEAMLRLISELRTGSGTGAAGREHVLSALQSAERTATVADEEQKSKDEDSKDDDDDPWINLTTGTWPSPFFLLWADSIWRGSWDLGHVKAGQLDGLTPRQNWIVWR